VSHSETATQSSDHGAALTAGFLGWTLDAFDFFLVSFCLTAIGKVLSDSGIPITPGALRLYVSGTRTSAAGKRKRKTKRTDKQPLNAQPNAPAHTRGAASTQPAQPAGRPAGASPSVDLDWEHAPKTANAAPSPAGSPRAGFYVRPDREKI